MKFLIKLAATLLTLACITPAAASTVSFQFEGVGRGDNDAAQLTGTFSFNLDDGVIMKSNRVLTRHLHVAQLEGHVTGGHQNGMQFRVADTSVLAVRFPQSSFLLAGNQSARMMFRTTAQPFSQDVTVVSFTGGRLWLRDSSAALAPAVYDLTVVQTAQLVTVPLPSTFPIFLGACLATAFYGRRRKRVS